MSYYIYIATFTNSKQYIGYTNNPSRRKNQHRRRAINNYPQRFYCAIRKYGFEDITWLFMPIAETIEEASNLEIDFIKEYQTFNKDFGYNMTDGGFVPPSRLGIKHTEETKKKISYYNKSNGKIPPTQIGPQSKEHIEKRTASFKGKPGRKWTEEEKKRQSNKLKNIPKTKKHIENIKKSKYKKWLITNPDGIQFCVENLPLFCKENNLDARLMIRSSHTNFKHKEYKCEKIIIP